MEKLIELLNEYEAKRHKTSIVAEIRWQIEDRFTYLGLNSHYSELLCISKGYGFIKWLLDNDKININEEWDDYEETNLSCNSDFFQLQKHYSYYESLLMLLAIQDSPIEFLVSILR